MPIHTWSAARINKKFQEKAVSAVEIARSHLVAIEQQNEEIQAFVAYDAKQVLAQAEYLDQHFEQYREAPLAAVPFAVKDVIDSAYLPTSYGSIIYSGHIPGIEAACTQISQRRGAIMMGKVATGEFATQTPSAAKNPLRVTHTPGGSSSGSAAAVAAQMVPISFGTQTTGSIMRPAVYCGVAGYKPTFGLIGTAGVKTLSHTQDTVGLLGRSVHDLSFYLAGMFNSRPARPSADAPVIGVLYSRQWDYIESYMAEALHEHIEWLHAQGCKIKKIQMPEQLEHLATQQPRLFQFEAGQNLSFEYDTAKEGLSPRLQKRLAGANNIELDDYLGLRQEVLQAQYRMSKLFQDQGIDIFLYPAASGEALKGHKEAGDPRFGALWSLLHLPSVSFPIGKGPSDLPLGVQYVGAYGRDMHTLSAAQFIAQALSS